MRGEIEPEVAAAEYDAALAGVDLELLLLGLGSDGHMASLFPGSPQLEVEDRRVAWGPAGLEPFVDRVTLTLPAILSAQRIVFLVAGAGKAEAVALAFGGEISREAPASLARLAPISVEVFLDRPAASKLEAT
jgi:6-phosphogluconolactonase